ncbi:MAG TPA: hypothetical protein VF121_16375 [Thermoanaerobaculia bacterium]|nr:hypothetical protein [Thermoanaerobaculia bacterium]
MPNQEEVFASIVASVAEGANEEGIQLDASALEALRNRYFDWIVRPGKTKDGHAVGTPLQVWDGDDGGMLRKKFKKIGKEAGKKAKGKSKTKVDGEETRTSSYDVELGSDCDWCRPPIPPP